MTTPARVQVDEDHLDDRIGRAIEQHRDHIAAAARVEVAVELTARESRIAELEHALREIARRTIQRDLNQLAHAALGHTPNAHTVALLADEGAGG
ncbi:hypothetical protein GCM10009530_63390 [Microbispora corallina]|uniref:Uncharacterized protein n=1 Tax=Microbispora corallina TaxID=83302 RepID=A0ABQ4GBG9_9ACTN|nr:hypothetical protein [Microbispora corallina]GIH44431.1 hypothetical protein Mco01_74310 [Microbispora corallina]